MKWFSGWSCKSGKNHKYIAACCCPAFLHLNIGLLNSHKALLYAMLHLIVLPLTSLLPAIVLFFEHVNFCFQCVGWDTQTPYLCFFCFIMSLNPFCKPSLPPWSYRAQKKERLASDEDGVSIFQSDNVILLLHSAMLTLVAQWHFY